MRIKGVVSLLLLFGALATASASTVSLTNGVSGVGAWQVDVGPAGSSGTGNLTYAPGATTDVIYYYTSYVNVNGAVTDLSTLGTNPVLNNGSAISTGSFAGPNGTIYFTATSWITAGSSVLSTQYSLTSDSAFGNNVSILNYLDEDVRLPSLSDNNVIVFGTNGQAGFQLLTVGGLQMVGVAQSADFNPIGASYIGWGANYCCGVLNIAPNGYSNISSIVDPRYPGQTAYGPGDGTTTFGFLLDPNATSASVTFSVGGSPTGRPIDSQVPEPTTLALLGSGLGSLVLRRFRRS